MGLPIGFGRSIALTLYGEAIFIKGVFQQGIHQKCGDTQKYHLSADQPQYKGGGTLPEHNHKHCGQDAEKESDAQPELRDVPVGEGPGLLGYISLPQSLIIPDNLFPAQQWLLRLL